ncbi:hypothetical protein Tco_0626286 [Tanacetum coccineum]|uniref:MAK10-like protein n=1 Tax=Tanacetum coccineum TaxID=301880 RepID=A0ABQ4WJ54_9ASTR
MGDENLIPTLGDYSKPSHEGYRNTIELPEGNNVVSLRSDTIRLVQNGCSFHRLRYEDPNQHLKDFLKLMDSLDLDALLEYLALYYNESWNDPRDFAKLIKAISLPQDVPSTSDCRIVKLENQVQRLMEAHLAPKQPVQVNKITSSCEIYSGPHDTQYWMENPKQAFFEDASSRSQNRSFSTYSSSYQAKLERTLSEFDSHQERGLSSLGAQLRRQQDDMINKTNVLWKVFTKKLDDTSTRDTAGDVMAHVNAASIDRIEKEELQSKGIKSPSKLLSLKYLSQASLEEQNRNPSSPKRVHFINCFVILHKEDEVREEENVMPNTTEYNDYEITAKAEETVEEESEDELEEEIKEEEEEEEDDVEYFDTFPGLEETVLIYDKKEGTVAFKDNNEKLIFKMPHKMEMFKNVDFTRVSIDRIPPFIIGGNDDDNEKTHYSDSLTLGPKYKYDESYFLQETNVKFSQCMETASENSVTPSGLLSDRVRIFPDGVKPSDM